MKKKNKVKIKIKTEINHQETIFCGQRPRYRGLLYFNDNIQVIILLTSSTFTHTQTHHGPGSI